MNLPLKQYLALGLALSLTGCTLKGKEAPQEQTVAKRSVLTLAEQPVTLHADYPARIEGRVNVDIRPQVDGYLEKIFIEEGAYVRQGQPLFKIADAPYTEALHTAQANLSAARAALKSASLEVEKQTELVRNRVSSEFPLKAAKAALENAEANVAQQQAAVESARINVGFTVLRAPVSGYVGRIPRRVGNLASKTDAQALTQLTDISEVYAYFSLSEKDFLRLSNRRPDVPLPKVVAQLPPVDLMLADGTKYPHPGHIQLIDGQFDTQTGAIGVRAVFKNPAFLLRSGNTGRISLPETRAHALLVPTRATVDMQDKIFAFRVGPGNKAERVALRIAGKSGDHYVVESGLKPGDRIISAEVTTVTEGESFQPVATKE